MLQQTQVAAVIPYYRRFLARFPSIRSLATAEEDEVLQLWSGLGYYARGRNLHAAAKRIFQAGRFPDSASAIAELPGVGRSTAAAIAVFAFGRREAILDGNVKRVLARRFGVTGETALWRLAERLLPRRDIESYTQSLMDLGATVCTRAKPSCAACPLKRSCVARREGRIDQLPGTRQKAALKTRNATWLLLRWKNRILLERRPGSGLWGGLLTFPEAPGEDVPGYCRRVLGCQVDAIRELEALEHGFTHFRLRVLPLVCSVSKYEPRAESPQREWIALKVAARGAIPAPVRTLLVRLQAAR